MSRTYNPRALAHEAQSRHAGMVYVLMLVVALAFGGFVWQLYSEPSAPRITSPETPRQTRAAPTVPLNPPGPPIAIEERAEPPVAERVAAAPVAPAETADLPRFVSDGPYVAQLAALRSEAGVNAAWQRLAARAPDLFAAAQLDVERADLGQRGVYYRVRAGFFDAREDAAAFCERVRRMGHDCIVASR